METLIELSTSDDWRKRRQVALALRHFDHPRSSVTLQKLRQDPDHRVIAAALEELL